jgi:hypothetical protein
MIAVLIFPRTAISAARTGFNQIRLRPVLYDGWIMAKILAIC